VHVRHRLAAVPVVLALRSAFALMIGKTVGQYRLVRRLGEGGMGVVYLAEHRRHGGKAAVKLLRPDLAQNRRLVRRFFNEARAAGRIQHRGIVEIHDFGISFGGVSYITMEFLEGEELSTCIGRLGRLPVRQAVDIAGQVAGAVGAAHAKNITHRDLKPANLFLVRDPLGGGRELVKVLDFGIAKLEAHPGDAPSLQTRTGSVMGTPFYMSPEQCRGSRQLDHRADLYSLGVVLYEMLCGAPPFVSDSFGEMVFMHIGVPPPPLRAKNPDVPPELESIVLRLLAKDPAERFASMADLERALHAIAPRKLPTPEPAVDPTNGDLLLRRWLSTPVPASPPPPRPGRALVLAGGLVCVGGLLLLALTAPGRPAGPVHTDIVTDPPGAAIFDEADRLVEFTPYHQVHPSRGSSVRLRIEKGGYLGETVVVPNDRDFSRKLSLRPARKPPPRP
jgi:serine/threonine protein kinase